MTLGKGIFGAYNAEIHKKWLDTYIPILQELSSYKTKIAFGMVGAESQKTISSSK